jgi:predicted Holliday junction resolvase-like endonuclease
MFNPVTYVVFNGMSQGKVTQVQLLARPPHNYLSEQVQSSIERTVSNANIEFRTLRVDHRGRVESGEADL